MSLLEQYDSYLQNPNIRGLLNAIRWAEGTPDEKGYFRMLGGKHFSGNQHPRAIQGGGQWPSDAAGAYQFLSPTWDEAAKALGLRDFSPQNQDRAALWLIEQKRRVPLSEIAAKGATADTFHRLAGEWASLPTAKGGSAYGQPSKRVEELLARARAGGASAGVAPISPTAQPQPPSQPSEDPVSRVAREVMGASPSRPFDVPGAPGGSGPGGRNSDPVSNMARAVLGGGLATGGWRPAGEAMGFGSDDVISAALSAVMGRPTRTAPAPADGAQVAAAMPNTSLDWITQPGASNGSQTPAGGSGGREIGIKDLGKWLQGAGLKVAEHSAFGGVGGHSQGSLHYKDLALDLTDWKDPGESKKSWQPRKKWLGEQIASIMAGSGAEVFSPHNDPEGHGEHIHLGLPSGKISEEQARRIVAARAASLQKFPLRWAG